MVESDARSTTEELLVSGDSNVELDVPGIELFGDFLDLTSEGNRINVLDPQIHGRLSPQVEQVGELVLQAGNMRFDPSDEVNLSFSHTLRQNRSTSFSNLSRGRRKASSERRISEFVRAVVFRTNEGFNDVDTIDRLDSFSHFFSFGRRSDGFLDSSFLCHSF